MSFSHDDVQRLIKLLDSSHFDELHLEAEGIKLTLRRNGAPSTAPADNHVVSIALVGRNHCSHFDAHASFAFPGSDVGSGIEADDVFPTAQSSSHLARDFTE